jgi:hypothetical protein
MRKVACLVGVLLLVGTTNSASGASTTSACHAVVDPKGDVSRDIISKTRPGEPSSALDLLGGDLAADQHTVTAVVRLLGQAAPDSSSPMGYDYRFQFTVNTADNPQTFEMDALIGPSSQLFEMSRVDSGGGTGLGAYIRGVVDPLRHEVRMNADMSQLQQLAGGALQHPVGHDLSDLVITSGTVTGSPSLATLSIDGDDTAYGRVKVRIGAPSCVRLGQ